MIKPGLIRIKDAAQDNTFFRQVLFTASNSQVVVMALEPGQDIGEESHDGDQVLYVVKGEGEAVLDGVREPFGKGVLVCVPAGVRHNIVNTGDETVRLITVYAPPEHAEATVHRTKADAQAAEEPEATAGATPRGSHARPKETGRTALLEVGLATEDESNKVAKETLR